MRRAEFLSKNQSHMKPFLKLFRRHWKGLGLGTLLGLATVCAGIGLLGLAGWFIAAAAFAGLSTLSAQLFNLFLPSVGIRVFAIVRTAARYAERIVSHEVTFRLLQSLRVWFYQKIEPLAPARLMEFRSGDILNRIVADIDALDNLYLRVVSPTVVAVIAAMLVFSFLSIFEPVIAAIVCLTIFAGGFIVSAAALRAGSRIGARLNRQTTDLRVTIIDSLQGMAELLIFGAHEDQKENIRKCDRELIRSQLQMSRVKATASGLITLISGIALVVVITIGIGRVHQGNLDGAHLAMMVFITLAAIEAVLPLPVAYQFLGHTREAARRLLEVVGTKPQVKFPSDSKKEPSHFDVHFDEVTFSYREELRPALKGVKLQIGNAERVAVLGQTGAGKSTLANLLMRFWDPQHGGIRIGGIDIREMCEADLRRLMAVVTQQAHMFNASLRDNLLLANPQAKEANLTSALKSAGLWDLLTSLPEGLDTWIGESGRRLSAGQARRVALARAIIKDAPIWVLDEPTEGLDRITEQSVMGSLLELTRHRTVLLITHRLVALENMDRIVVIENGRILEEGSHSELLTRPSRYAELTGGIEAR